MSSGDPDRPPQPWGAVEYPSLEDSPDAWLPPPVYPPPPPGYYQAYDPYAPTKLPGTNGKAIASLVISAASIVFCCGLPSFVGMIVGISAMRETRRTGQDGYGLALAGTIIGGLATAGLLIYIVFLVALMASGWQWTWQWT